MNRCGLAVLLALFAGCSDPPGGAVDAAGGADGAVEGDATIPIPPFEPGPEPTSPLDPVAGELTIEQLDLPAGLTVKIGESEIVVGPDGTIVVIDVGNTSHEDELRAEIERLNTQVLVPARGFAPRTRLQVEWIVITHFHADHVGALPGLLGGSSPLQIVHGVVHRGWTDVGDALNPSAFQDTCELLRGAAAALDRPLCEAGVAAPCAQSAWTGAYPATSCSGLTRGDLTTSADDTSGAASFIPLGGGARLTLIGANAFFSSGSAIVAAAPFDHAQNGQENARSVVGIVEQGWFRYHFAGDLTGEGNEESPDVESALVATSGAAWYGPRGVDVIHAHHHVRKTSSNLGFVGMAAPADGHSRNVIGGVSEAYVLSPYAIVLATFADAMRLGDGWIWVPHVAAGGASHSRLDVASGPVLLQTIQAGRGYRIQAAGAALHSRAYPSVAAE